MAWFISALFHGVLFLVLIGMLGVPQPAVQPSAQTSVFISAALHEPGREPAFSTPSPPTVKPQAQMGPSTKSVDNWPFEKQTPRQSHSPAVVCQKDPWLLRVAYGDSPAQVARVFGSFPAVTRAWQEDSGELFYAAAYVSSEGRFYSAIFNTNGLIKSGSGRLEEILYAHLDEGISRAVQRGELSLSAAEGKRLLTLKQIYGPQLPASWILSMQVRIRKAQLFESGAISANDFYAGHAHAPKKTNC